jgi:hypothetical protein
MVAAMSGSYVERLYNMVSRHMPVPMRFHVWTEHDRSVPPHMIKHCSGRVARGVGAEKKLVVQDADV